MALKQFPSTLGKLEWLLFSVFTDSSKTTWFVNVIITITTIFHYRAVEQLNGYEYQQTVLKVSTQINVIFDIVCAQKQNYDF